MHYENLSEKEPISANEGATHGRLNKRRPFSSALRGSLKLHFWTGWLLKSCRKLSLQITGTCLIFKNNFVVFTTCCIITIHFIKKALRKCFRERANFRRWGRHSTDASKESKCGKICLDMILELRLSTVSSYFLSKTILNAIVFLILNSNVIWTRKTFGDKNLKWIISPKGARTLALCGDHSNYTFEQAGYNTVGRGCFIVKIGF
jgi:hypothetical protein